MTEPLIGYRAWSTTSEGILCALHQTSTWIPREKMTAECKRRKREYERHGMSPYLHVQHELVTMPKDCTCGIYAFKTIDGIFGEMVDYMKQRNSRIIVGTVALWGEVHIFGAGYRAQYAYPQGFYNFPWVDVQIYANSYGVEVFPIPEDYKGFVRVMENSRKTEIPYVKTEEEKRMEKEWYERVEELRGELFAQ